MLTHDSGLPSSHPLDKLYKGYRAYLVDSFRALKEVTEHAFCTCDKHFQEDSVGALNFPAVVMCLATLNFLAGFYYGYNGQLSSKKVVAFASKYYQYDANTFSTCYKIFRHVLMHTGRIGMQDKNGTSIYWILQRSADRYPGLEHMHIKKHRDGIQLFFSIEQFVIDTERAIEQLLEDFRRDENLQKNIMNFINHEPAMHLHPFTPQKRRVSD